MRTSPARKSARRNASRIDARGMMTRQRMTRASPIGRVVVAMPAGGVRRSRTRAVRTNAIASARPTLFLDVDGVLNETATAKQIALDEDKVMLLRDVLERSDAEIVLTTYWRYFREYLAYAFVRHGLPDRVVGKTAGEPHRADSVAHDAAVSTNRVMEIEAYLRATHGEDEEAWPVFAIVDDKEVVAEGHRWRGKFVRTRHDEGLTRARADELVSILSAEKALVV